MIQALSFPDPQVLAVAQVRDVLIPRVREMREDIQVRGDLEGAQELKRRINAFQRYVTDRKAKALLEAEARRTEVLIGHLLGPAAQGDYGRGRPIESHTGDSIPKDDRRRFRLLAEHEDKVEELLTASAPVVVRSRILDAIARDGRSNCQHLVEGTFTTITADPPWQYDNRATRAAADDHYQTLTVPQVCAVQVDGVPVRDRAPEGAHLYLWTTNAFLCQAFEVLDAWGFAYKTTLTWVKGRDGKAQLGIGNYFRSCTEHVLFGVRGSLPVKDSNQPNWFEARRGQHSRKPDLFYDLVERASPGPYLELFGRTDPLRFPPRDGWTVWGNEA